VAMLEKLTLLKIAFCKAPALSNAFVERFGDVPFCAGDEEGSRIFLGMANLCQSAH
jgi:hypothetical protein